MFKIFAACFCLFLWTYSCCLYCVHDKAAHINSVCYGCLFFCELVSLWLSRHTAASLGPPSSTWHRCQKLGSVPWHEVHPFLGTSSDCGNGGRGTRPIRTSLITVVVHTSDLRTPAGRLFHLFRENLRCSSTARPHMSPDSSSISAELLPSALDQNTVMASQKVWQNNNRCHIWAILFPK